MSILAALAPPRKEDEAFRLRLSVAYGIVRDHKGITKLNRVLGQGTTFAIRLPAWKAGEEHGAT